MSWVSYLGWVWQSVTTAANTAKVNTFHRVAHSNKILRYTCNINVAKYIFKAVSRTNKWGLSSLNSPWAVSVSAAPNLIWILSSSVWCLDAFARSALIFRDHSSSLLFSQTEREGWGYQADIMATVWQESVGVDTFTPFATVTKKNFSSSVNIYFEKLNRVTNDFWNPDTPSHS